jgi:holliday junction DNA helicase RuvA
VIASVRGPVQHVGLDRVVLEVGGVGLLLHTTPGTASALRRGQEATLATTLVVREDSLTLYAFGTDDERDVFEQVQTVSGVGPRLALAMLAVLDPDRLRAAIGSGEVAALTTVPGIGKKGAERLVLELRDRLGSTTSDTSLDGPAPAGLGSVTAVAPWRDQLTAALVSLGWTGKEAESAVSQLAPVADEQVAATGGVEIAVLLRQALRLLGRA